MRILGWILAVGLYILLGMHVYAYFMVICPLLKQRLGVTFGMTWAAIGLILLYNIVFNHFLAMVLKPSNPQDLQKVEEMRLKAKNRQHRRETKDDGKDDRFEGLHKDVKRLMKYKTKTIKDL